MSKFTDRTGKALLVIDVQNDVVGDAWRRYDVTLAEDAHMTF